MSGCKLIKAHINFSAEVVRYKPDSCTRKRLDIHDVAYTKLDVLLLFKFSLDPPQFGIMGTLKLYGIAQLLVK